MQTDVLPVSSFIPSFNRQHFFTSLMYAFLPLYSAVVIGLIIDQSLNSQIESVLRSPDGLTGVVWVWGGLSLLSSLFFPILMTMLCCFFITEKIKGQSFFDFGPFFKRHFEMTLLETLRAWASMFLWFFVFIIPALYRFVAYAMMPFIVIYSKKYERGEVDALDYSKIASKEVFLKIFFSLLFFYILLPMASTLIFDQYKVFRIHPVQMLLISVIDTLLIFYIHFLLLKLFFNSSFFKGESHVAHV